MPRKGLTTARTGTPAAINSSITLAHPEASAKAPWTRTTGGALGAELVSVTADSFRCRGCRARAPSRLHPRRRSGGLRASDDDADDDVITGGRWGARDDR